MADYDDIVIPTAGQPVSSSTFGKKVRDYIIDLGARMTVREAAEELPSPISGTGGNSNSITAAINTWQTIGPNGVAVNVTNPSTIFDLICLVFFGGWMNIATAGNLRMGINVTGGVTSDPEPGFNSPVGFGMMPITSVAGLSQQCMGMFQLEIPAGAATVTLTAQGQRSAANAANINYPAINVIPIRYR